MFRIALDGCDGTGKTTLAEKLANKLGCNIVRLTNGGDRSFDTYFELMECINVVHDRTFMSEIIYPKYFNRESRIDSNTVPLLYDLVDWLDVKIFILTASNKIIRDRIEIRGDEFISDMNLFEQINADYVKLAKEHNYIIIDTSNKSINDLVDEIGGYLK